MMMHENAVPVNPPVIVMCLRPHIEAGGFHIDRFDGLVDGVILITSRQPAYDGARKLIAAGYDPDAQITIISPSGTAWPPQRLGALAKWTVSERDRGGLQRRKWAPFVPGTFKDGREP